MYFHPLVWSTQCWVFFSLYHLELQWDSSPPLSADTNSIVKVLSWHPIKCKVPAVRFSLGEGLHKSCPGIPSSRWYLLVPPLSGQWTENGSLPCHMSEALSYFDKLLHLDPRLAVTVSNFYCDDCDSLSHIVFAALIQSFTVAKGWVMTQQKDLTVSSRVMINMQQLFSSISSETPCLRREDGGPLLPDCHFLLAPPQVKD